MSNALKIIGCWLFSLPLLAQISPAPSGVIIYVTSSPLGNACTPAQNPPLLNYAGTVYSCQSSAYAVLPSGGSAGVSTFNSRSGTVTFLATDIPSGGDLTGTTVSKVDGTSVPTNAASDQALITNAAASGLWASLPNCQDSGGNHLNYNTTTHGFTCGTSSSGGGGFANPMTTLGDLIYGAASGTATRFAGYTTANTAVLTQTGTGSASAAPVWSNAPALSAANMTSFPTLNQNTTGSAASFTGSLSGDVTGTQSATVVGKINGTSLAGLATGILKNTTSTGVPSIAVAGTDYQAPITLTTTGTSGAATFISNVLNIPQYTGGGGGAGAHNLFFADQYSDIPTAADACNTAGGGDVYVLVPGTYTISRTINLGAVVTSSYKTTCNMYVGGGVTFNVTITNHSPAVRIFDGSAIRGESIGFQNNSSGTNAQTSRITCTSATVSSLIEEGVMDGSQEEMGVFGLYLHGSGCTTDTALLHMRGTSEMTTVRDVFVDGFPGIGILVDAPTNQTFTPTSVSGSGSTATVTVAASTVNDPEATGVSLGQTFVMSNCSIAGFNGTYTVSAMAGPNSFTYANATSGSPTSCTYVPTVAFAGSTGVSVLDNVHADGSGATGQKPIVFSTVGATGGQVTDFKLINTNAQRSDPAGGTGCSPSGTNPCWGNITIDAAGGSGTGEPTTITLDKVHVEASTSAVVGVYLRDVHDIYIRDLTAASSGGDVIRISCSTSSHLFNLNFENIENANWTNTINQTCAAPTARTYAASGFGSKGIAEYHFGVANSGSSNCESSNSATYCAPVIWDNANLIVGPDTHLNTFSAGGDTWGTITLSSGSGSYTFKKTWQSAPVCFVQDPLATAVPTYTTSTTTLTVTGSGSHVVNYFCMGNVN